MAKGGGGYCNDSGANVGGDGKQKPDNVGGGGGYCNCSGANVGGGGGNKKPASVGGGNKKPEELAQCVEVGLPALVVMVFILQYLNRFISTKKPVFDRFAILFSVAVAWLYALLLTSSTVYNHKPERTQTSCGTDHAGLVTSAPWIYFPYPSNGEALLLIAGEALAMMTASFVSLFESTGTFYVAARYGMATTVPPSVISRGTGWVAVRFLLNGMFGSVTGSTASMENASLLALTKVGSRRVIQISAGFMIFFSIVVK
ncbi:hypothetical protein L6164_015520 [Bauhinia variegata]|uniref:Uncharacterized protein n=1 Tax=Bauhinia variegata TaxID=167791 RepID=A0ACB9NKR9_BAUVA|nr:hypothetical protein L6164_015520 [Bauhinia variegata]